jgi:hypothetical protein
LDPGSTNTTGAALAANAAEPAAGTIAAVTAKGLIATEGAVTDDGLGPSRVVQGAAASVPPASSSASIAAIAAIAA